MKANEAPEKIYVLIDPVWGSMSVNYNRNDINNIEYVRPDALIDKALKWYCLDCECNDNCKDSKCFFYREYERYLKGNANAIPPKFSDVILNEDGSTSDNWRYRHFIRRMQDAFIEKACDYLQKNLWRIVYEEESEFRQRFVTDFKNYMKGE